MEQATEVPRAVLLRLGHGCLELLARDAGARILHIKGEAMDPGLREGRPQSTDCDVLVHPDDVGAFVQALSDAGWENLTRFEHGSVFGHAATYYSPVWGTVDVHRTFPGLDRDPLRTFETLWGARQEVELGGVACPVPDLRAQRLILLVHAARDAMGRRDHDVEAAWGSADPEERDRLDALALDLGATVPLALVTGRDDLAAGLPGEHVWRAVGGGATSAQIWRARISDARSPLARARLLLDAARINPDHLALRLGRTPTRRDRWHEWRVRWARGLRGLRRNNG